MSAPASTVPLSEIERVEAKIAAHLKLRLPNDVFVDVHPDDPASFDMAGKGRAVLVHFAQTQPTRSPAVKLSMRTGYAVLCMARSLRGASSGYALVEAVETAIAGETLPGCRAFAVLRSRLEGQSGGLWRWVVEIETETVRGRVTSPFAPFIPGFQKVEAP